MPNEGPDQWGIRDSGWLSVGTPAITSDCEPPNLQAEIRESARKRAEEHRKYLEEERVEEERRRAEEEAKAIAAKLIGWDDDDYKIIAEAIDHEKLLQRRGGKYYAPNQQKLYTGWSKSMHDNGQMMALWQYKGGKLMSAIVWKPNGEKCPVTKVVNGNGIVVVYGVAGTELGRMTYEDGKQVRF